MMAVDQKVLLVALPTLTQTLTTDLTTVQRTLRIYDLILIGVVITVERVGNLFGRKRICMTGFLLFIFSACAACLTRQRSLFCLDACRSAAPC